VISTETRAVRRLLAPWLAQTETPADAVARIEQVLDAQLETGLEPRREDDGSLSFVQSLSALICRGPGGPR
jgi:hypothetical protein